MKTKKSPIMIDFNQKKIVVGAAFSEKARYANSREYTQLQKVRLDYPEYSVEVRSIKKSAKKEAYRGLSYSFMKDYIDRFDPTPVAREEFEVLLIRSKCHSTRYPAVKHWFLSKYPEAKDLLMKDYRMHSDEESREVA